MTIVAVDHKFRVARQAAERLRNAGIDCGLVNLRYLKPLPEHALAEILSTIPRVVTLEEGVLDGGVGSAIATGLRSPAHVRSASPRLVAHVREPGSQDELCRIHGLDVDDLEFVTHSKFQIPNSEFHGHLVQGPVTGSPTCTPSTRTSERPPNSAAGDHVGSVMMSIR